MPSGEVVRITIHTQWNVYWNDVHILAERTVDGGDWGSGFTRWEPRVSTTWAEIREHVQSSAGRSVGILKSAFDSLDV